MTAPLDGRCTCGEVRYRLHAAPMFVHCCHCTWCQRESGSAFALNAMIEADRLETLAGAPVEVALPSNSGKGQVVLRCPGCQTALWSFYGGAGRAVAFVRVGTLDNPAACPPDVHIYTSTKQPWVQLGGDVPVFVEYYRRSEVWPAAAVARYTAALGR